MIPAYRDDELDVYQGDALAVLAELPAESVDCVVTSPPYWGLRDYGTARWEGGSEECDHARPVSRDTSSSTLGTPGHMPGPNTHRDHSREPLGRAICPRCGARRVDSQIGLEETPEAYVEKLVDVFREVRRVLRSDGTLWLNLGDSYARTGGTDRKVSATATVGSTRNSIRQRGDRTQKAPSGVKEKAPSGVKEKDLVGIPWRVAFALQADGWYLRSDIVWAKPNPMPESVTDRPTRAHEFVFLLTKSPRYFFDADAVREGRVPAELARDARGYRTRPHGGIPVEGLPPGRAAHGGFANERLAGSVRKRPSGWNDGATEDDLLGRYPKRERDVGGRGDGFTRMPGGSAMAGVTFDQDGSGRRNIRDVWTIATQPFAGAHFATFPVELVERCLRAGSRVGGTVLDPFGGSGTVGLVARRWRRKAILVELNPEYVRMAIARATGGYADPGGAFEPDGLFAGVE